MELSIGQYSGWNVHEVWINSSHVYRAWFAVVTCMFGMAFVVVMQVQARPWRQAWMWLSTTLAALLFGAAIPLVFLAYLIASTLLGLASHPFYTIIILTVLNAFFIALICSWVLRRWGVQFTSRMYRLLVLLNACATGFALGMMIDHSIRNPAIACVL